MCENRMVCLHEGVQEP